MDENGPISELASNKMVPPNRFLERLTKTRFWMDQNQPGTEPLRELLERSIFCKCDMFLRNFHERVPLRFLDERFISVIGGYG